jgi:hypothetical protein
VSLLSGQHVTRLQVVNYLSHGLSSNVSSEEGEDSVQLGQVPGTANAQRPEYGSAASAHSHGGQMMKPSQAFGVAVRIFGLLTWLASLAYAASAITVLLSPHYRPDVSPWSHYLMAAAIWFFTGWFLLRRADRIVAFAYHPSSSDGSE